MKPVHRLVTAAALLAALVTAQKDAAPAAFGPVGKGPAPHKGDPQFYFATYPDFVVQFDPKTDEIVRKIKLQNGMPWGATLLHDQQRFAVITDRQTKIEIVDRAKGEVTDVHDFAEEGYIIRVRSVMEHPGGARWYVRTERIKKEIDRYKFERGQYLLYDPAEKKVEKKLKRLPRALSSGARISPDGKYWHVFARGGDLRVLEPETLKEVGKVDLSTPLFTGMGRLNLGRTDLFFGENPKMYRMLCTVSDPVQRNRTAWGYVDIDLDSYEIGDFVEWGRGPSGWGTYVARDAKLAVANAGGFGGRGGSSKSTIALYDLETGRKLRDMDVSMRPRQSLSGISPDGTKIYIGGAGSDFQVYNAETMEKIKVVELDGEIYGRIHVLDG